MTVGLAAGALTAIAGAQPAAATTTTQTFTSVGSATFVVPAGVTSLTVVAQGGKGADGGGNMWVSSGGEGGRETATIAVTPGESLQIVVGSAATSETGGSNGGGTATSGTTAGGGGGASDVRQGGTALVNRVVVAGGGGGGGRSGPGSHGGNGGGGGGTAGSNADGVTQGGDVSGAGGGAGTNVAGGAGGVNNGAGVGNPGTLGVGGNGPSTCEDPGAGGGGYYGGGSGSAGCWNGGGGGGGGSNYATAGATSVLSENGINTGSGSVVVSWIEPIPTTTTIPTTLPPTTLPAATPVAPLLSWSCPKTPVRFQASYPWVANALRFWCRFTISRLRNHRTVVTYLVPPGWRWKWVVNPHRR